MDSFSLILSLIFSLILVISFPSQALSYGSLSSSNAPVGIIRRARKQQIIAYITPDSQEKVVPFLTSPLGKYTAFLVRHGSLSRSNGYRKDFCFVQVQETETRKKMWESQCASIHNVNACTLLFSKKGMEIFDGSKSVWDTNADSTEYNFLVTLELVDEGDMRIHDKDGKLAWKASETPGVNTHCGVKMARSARPPFAQSIGQEGDLPRAADLGLGGQGGRMNGVGQAFGFSDLPLVDNTPYDSSGTCKRKYNWVGVFVGFVAFVLMMEFGT
ncbi:hypothetical protein LUZ60_015145 [Juncus effusus]|nr:hypothetical protein LUZ60_015145 [Juncus effusus]